MAKWHPVMYTDTPQENPIIDAIKEVFNSCVSGESKDNTENNSSSIH